MRAKRLKPDTKWSVAKSPERAGFDYPGVVWVWFPYGMPTV